MYILFTFSLYLPLHSQQSSPGHSQLCQQTSAFRFRAGGLSYNTIPDLSTINYKQERSAVIFRSHLFKQSFFFCFCVVCTITFNFQVLIRKQTPLPINHSFAYLYINCNSCAEFRLVIIRYTQKCFS